MVNQLARHTWLHHNASAGFRALCGPGCAVSVDMQEQYGLSLPLELQLLVVQRFHGTDDLEQGFTAGSSQVVRTVHYKPPAPDSVAVLDDLDELTGLQRGAGASAGALAALHSLKRKYDATAAGEAAARWNRGGNPQPSGNSPSIML
ncbi:hypothetical protein ABPG77_010298 [Micractinium sp. CCAP 211/92]